MTTAAAVLDGLCRFYGGPEDPPTHTYRSPTISGLSVVRRAWAKRDDSGEYYVGKPPGTATGCQMVVQLPRGGDRRATFPAVAGLRKTRYGVELHCFIRSTASYSEDTQDFGYQLRDQIIAKVRTDPTCGSGGFEQGGFQVGEGDGPDVEWEYDQAETNTDDVTLAYLKVTFEAHAYEQG